MSAAWKAVIPSFAIVAIATSGIGYLPALWRQFTVGRPWIYVTRDGFDECLEERDEWLDRVWKMRLEDLNEDGESP
ncbi:hypothetical protein NDN08_000801 [Rhodosorus marinus]|uniref:Transmembrane protein n=1 Tax=Rhodosorus marinus TaxID=101924 RepID=A0AAV8UP54_9RHOD|nr:hypothetical protein NDN08_000801 [Rhodosorus marinus]